MHQEEEQVRHALIAWAQRYFAPGLDDPKPEVTILSLGYNQAEDEWEAELAVSTCADHPHVTCWLDDIHPLQENRLHIEAVEY
jgi:hypothetical protein